VRLAVAGAFHTSYMAPAAEKLKAALEATKIVTPRIPVISNVDAQPHSDPAVIKAILAQQVGGRGTAGGLTVPGPGTRCGASGRMRTAGPSRLLRPAQPDCPPPQRPAPPPARPPPQLTSPVQWETTLKTLLDKGLEKSYEVRRLLHDPDARPPRWLRARPSPRHNAGLGRALAPAQPLPPTHRPTPHPPPPTPHPPPPTPHPPPPTPHPPPPTPTPTQVGPGKVIAGIMKRIDKKAEITNVEA
jgi:hypothetical protein